jgi:AcrR family transcriptional regulator
MLDALQGGKLADTHEGKPGLPRGRSSLPAPDVRASQRERLRRAVIAAVAESGYPAVRVADIVRRARVSRAAFYAHFADKEACFLAAAREGGKLMTGQVVAATRALPAGTPDEDVLRAACSAFLGFLADEPAFARVFYVDMPAAGPRATERLAAAARRFAEMTAKWHRRARARHPDWPEVPGEAYLGLAGAAAELVRSRVRDGQTDALPELEDTLVSLHLAVLAARPWPWSAAAKPLLSYSPISPSLACPVSRLRADARTLAITRWPERPAAVRIDSGWNWTAQRPAASSSIAITTPSGVAAVTVNPPFTAVSTAYSEW